LRGGVRVRARAVGRGCEGRVFGPRAQAALKGANIAPKTILPQALSPLGP
jgi:hypothetical protein